jgi:hypothetical protein
MDASAHGEHCCASRDDRVVVWKGTEQVGDFHTREDISSLKLEDVVYTLSASGVRTWSIAGVPRHTLILPETLTGYVMEVSPSLFLSDLDTLQGKGLGVVGGDETLVTAGYAFAVGRRVFYADALGGVGVHTPGSKQEGDIHLPTRVCGGEGQMQVTGGRLYAMDDKYKLRVWN